MGETKITGGTFDPTTKAVQWKIHNEFMGTVTYKGTLDGENISGNVSNEDGEFAMTFKMTRTSKQVEPTASPAAEKPTIDKPAGEQPAAPTKTSTGAGS
jgi:hypothetical protein